MLPHQPTANQAEQYPHMREKVIYAPDDVPEEDCGDMVTLIGSYKHPGSFQGYPTIISFWKPSEEELAILNDGGSIELLMFTNGLVPMAMNAVKK